MKGGGVFRRGHAHAIRVEDAGEEKVGDEEGDDEPDEEDAPDTEEAPDMDDRAEEEAQVIEEVTRQQRLAFKDEEDE